MFPTVTSSATSFLFLFSFFSRTLPITLTRENFLTRGKCFVRWIDRRLLKRIIHVISTESIPNYVKSLAYTDSLLSCLLSSPFSSYSVRRLYRTSLIDFAEKLKNCRNFFVHLVDPLFLKIPISRVKISRIETISKRTI